jgi:F420-dependent methylenetetrahydromethanopterin dehydrogenase
MGEKKKKLSGAGRRWLPPVILATQEAEIRRIEVRSQPVQIVQETLSQKIPNTKRAVE